MSDNQPTVVLVHGALTDASIWHPVIAELHRRGHRVVAPPLPMRGLDTDAAALRSVLDALEDGPVVAVGHSWGGSVISDPDALTPAVRHLVFVAAFIQDAGESAGELNGRFPGSRLLPETTVVRHTPDGPDMQLRPEHFASVYAADVDVSTTAVMAAAQRGINPEALGEHFDGPAAWRTLPSWSLIATADRSIPTEAQRFMSERAAATTIEVDSSHALPVSAPARTADVIATAVAALGATTGLPS